MGTKATPPKKCPGFEPSECGFCSAEIVQDRTARRPELVVSAGGYRNRGHNPKRFFISVSGLCEQWLQPRKIALNLNLDENAFIVWKLSTIEGWRLGRNFLSTRRLREQSSQRRGFGVFSCGIQRHVLNDQERRKRSGNKG